MINQLALDVALEKMSPQTNFIHDGDLIPLEHNMLYALALLRTRIAEKILEARTLIERLLPFQLENGNFPANLHEWPNGYDRFLGSRLLIPMHWILRHFGHVLGSDLEKRFSRSKQALSRYLLTALEDAAPTDLTTVQVLAVTGDASCNEILDRFDPWLYNVPKHMGKILAAYQVIDPTLQRFIPYLEGVVDPHTLSYAGPPVNEYQAALEPEPTLFDLYIASLTGTTPKRLKSAGNTNLWAAAVEPTQERLQPKSPCFHSHASGSVAENFYKGEHHFRYLWGDSNRVHSLTCQGGTLTDFKVEVKDNIFTFDMTLPTTEEEQQRDISFYLDYQPLSIEVNGKPSTTFTCNDTVSLLTEERSFTFNFSPTEGLIGHIMRGNRPSQRSLTGDKRYEAYDWTLFLRSVYREGATPFQITLSIK